MSGMKIPLILILIRLFMWYSYRWKFYDECAANLSFGTKLAERKHDYYSRLGKSGQGI